MAAIKVLLCITFGLFSLYSVYATCGLCSATTYAACVSQTSFKMCPDGLNASDTVIDCPENEVCTEEQGVCKPADLNYTLGCETVSASLECGKCNGLFACVSRTEFALCDENGTLGVVVGCDNGKTCNIETYSNGGAICSCSCADEPTCSNAAPPTTTTAAPIVTWKNSCDSVTTSGFYKNTDDPTCTSYVYCESASGSMNSILYNCTTGYFNQTSKKCVATKPSGCV